VASGWWLVAGAGRFFCLSLNRILNLSGFVIDFPLATSH
jgi:hypothetical protein